MTPVAAEWDELFRDEARGAAPGQPLRKARPVQPGTLRSQRASHSSLRSPGVWLPSAARGHGDTSSAAGPTGPTTAFRAERKARALCFSASGAAKGKRLVEYQEISVS